MNPSKPLAKHFIMNFEVLFNGAFNVSGANVTLLDEMPDPAGLPNWSSPGPHHPTATNQIVQADQDIHAHFDWDVSGMLQLAITGTWTCTVYIEPLGGGPDLAPLTATTPLVNAFSKSYNASVTIPAGYMAPGTYRITTTLTLANGATPLPVAGFEDKGIIQVYTA